MEVVAEGESGHDAVRLCRELRPSLLLTDIEMESKVDGLEAIDKIRCFDSDVKIIVLTVYDSDDFIVDSFVYGADNFIIKDQTHTEMLSIIESTLNGEAHISQIVAKKLKNHVVSNVQKKQQEKKNYVENMRTLSVITKTEMEILLLLRQGLTRKEISSIKMVELGTIKTHITNILKKFKRNRVSVLIKEFEEAGFFDCLESMK